MLQFFVLNKDKHDPEIVHLCSPVKSGYLKVPSKLKPDLRFGEFL
jgi:hypothetical protein